MVSVEDELPPEGVYVLVHLTLGNWRDSSDQDGVYFKVAKLKRGLTQVERDRLPDFDVRKRTYRGADEWSNNQRGFCWNEFGSSSWFGQDVDYWAPLPREILKED